MEAAASDGVDADFVIDDGDDEHGLGLKGLQRIRKMLSQHNPVNVIHEFQDRNGLHFANTGAVVNFLDLLGITRHSVHTSLNDKLLVVPDPGPRSAPRVLTFAQRHVADKLAKATPAQTDALLRASFRFVRVAGLNQVPIAILSRTESIPAPCLDQLAQHGALLDTLPVTVVRQVWAAHPALFTSRLVDLFELYVSDAHRTRTFQPYYSPVASAVCDRRSSDAVLQQLVDWIGTSFALYEICLGTVRDRFAATNHYGYCVLRMELLMSLHDMGREAIVALDPIHQLTWCLNAACRERSMEGRLMGEFAAQYVQLKEGGDVVPDSGELAPEMVAQLQDLSMVIAHPFVTNVLLRSIEANLVRIVRSAQDDHLPKDDEQLRVLTQALYVGCNVRKLLRARRQFKLPKCPHPIFRKLYPLLGVLVLNVAGVDSVAEGLSNALANDKGQICLHILMAFTISFLSSYEYDRAAILFGVLGQVDGSSVSTAPLSPFYRFMASVSMAMTLDGRHRSHLSSTATFRERFFVSFLLPISKWSEQAKAQCYELLSAFSSSIPVSELAEYLISLEHQSDHVTATHELYQQLLADVPGLADAIESRRSQQNAPDNDMQMETKPEPIPGQEDSVPSSEAV